MINLAKILMLSVVAVLVIASPAFAQGGVGPALCASCTITNK